MENQGVHNNSIIVENEDEVELQPPLVGYENAQVHGCNLLRYALRRLYFFSSFERSCHDRGAPPRRNRCLCLRS